jgi:carbohydrate diacid regulator
MQIVMDISNIINQNVNMMDERGMIIASTDVERIGTFHEAALRIINENLDSLIIHEDHEYKGARKGLNLPILLEGAIVGVIGVTGNYKDIARYGQIIKKMTEILILENSFQEQKKIDDRIKARFLDEWLFEDAPEGYGNKFTERGARFGIDVTLQRRALVAEITDITRYRDSADGQRLIDMVNRTVRHIIERDNQNVFTKTPSQMICLLLDCDDERIRDIAKEIRSKVKHQFDVEIRIGVDKRGTKLHQSYQRAKKALEAGKYSNEPIYFYDQITMELFMDEISDSSKKEFLLRIFRGLDEDEIAYWIQFLRIYFANNGSLEKTASQLFIHKNTVQNKLNHLSKLTGHDPRFITNSTLFVLAIQFYENTALRCV